MSTILLRVRDQHLDVVQAPIDPLLLHRHRLLDRPLCRILWLIEHLDNCLLFFFGPCVDDFALGTNYLKAALNEVIFERWYLILHAVVHIRMQLQ